jgi:hypothetical protein
MLLLSSSSLLPPHAGRLPSSLLDDRLPLIRAVLSSAGLGFRWKKSTTASRPHNCQKERTAASVGSVAAHPQSVLPRGCSVFRCDRSHASAPAAALAVLLCLLSSYAWRVFRYCRKGLPRTR